MRPICCVLCCAVVSVLLNVAAVAWAVEPAVTPAAAAPRPNILLILADDLGFSDLGCYGSQIATPNLDRLAAGGLRFTQFYNGARCCPTRAALLTGLYAHEAGVGHMLGEWNRPAYSGGLNEHCATFAELLQAAGYRTYHVGKWHVGGVGGRKAGAAIGRNHPLRRGFDRTFGTGGGGDFFKLQPLYLDDAAVTPDDKFYATDAFSGWGERFVRDHGRDHAGEPFLLHLCYTAPHFPLHAKPEDIANYRGRYRDGWDAERARRFARQKELGIVPRDCELSPRDPVATAWNDVPEAERDEWDLRMAVHAAMIDCMDQGIGRVLAAVREIGAEQNTVVMFLSDNGASAEFLDSWPDSARGHRPGSQTGTPESHRCLEIGWANAANTPFRENKMWAHEGGIATPLVTYWPAGMQSPGTLTDQVGHIIDILPTLLELAGATYPSSFEGRKLKPLAGRSLAPVFGGQSIGPRTLGWEHEGNRAIRVGDWKLVAIFRGPWELYDLAHDRTETHDLAAAQPEKVQELAAAWQTWADHVGVAPWEELPGANYRPTAKYRRKSEPVAE